MYRGRSKLLPAVLLAVIVIVAIVAVVSLGRAILNRGERTEVVDDSTSRSLLNTEADRSVRMIVRGPIVAGEDFRSYEIRVSPIERRMIIRAGYEGEAIETSQFGNSTEAYAEFVHALARESFTSKVQLPEGVTSTEGICAIGRLYTFEIMQAQTTIHQAWTSNCRDISGSFSGNSVQVRDLFQAQIPNSRELLRGLNI